MESLGSANLESLEVPNVRIQHLECRWLEGSFRHAGKILVQEWAQERRLGNRGAPNLGSGREQNAGDVGGRIEFQRAKLESAQIVFEPGQRVLGFATVEGHEGTAEFLAAIAEDDAIFAVSEFEGCHALDSPQGLRKEPAMPIQCELNAVPKIEFDDAWEGVAKLLRVEQTQEKPVRMRGFEPPRPVRDTRT